MTIVLAVGGGTTAGTICCSGGDEDELSMSDPVSPPVELELDDDDDDIYKTREAVIVAQDMKFAKLAES